MSETVVLAVGGTGGHLVPAGVVAKELIDQNPGLEVTFAGSGLKKNTFAKDLDYPKVDISSASFSFKRPVCSLWGMALLLKGVFQAFKLLSQKKPKLVIGFGSYHSAPVIIAAILKKIPLFLHDGNVYPGRVNRFFAKYAKTVIAPYGECRSHIKAPLVLTKMPLRQSLPEGIDKGEAKVNYGLDKDLFTLLIYGGSQGARYINQMASETFQMLADRGYKFQIIHLCGNHTEIKSLKWSYSSLNIPAVVKAYEPEMDQAFMAADFVLSRSGAMTLAELIEFELPAVLVPYPQAMEDHQDKNANFFVEQVAGGIKLKQEFATSEKLLCIFYELFDQDLKKVKEFLEHIKDFKETMPTKKISSYLQEHL